MAQGYNEAYQQYIKSDYKGAIVTLNKFVKTAFAKEELAPAFKLLGIVHYMEGNKKAASAAFRMALRNDPNVSISQSEVLDESVVEFFLDQKTIMEDEILMKRMKDEERKMGGAAGASASSGKAAGKAALAAPMDDAALDSSPLAKPKDAAPKPKKGAKNPKASPSLPPPTKGGAAVKNKPPTPVATGFSLLQLLPFGAGQFYNHSYWLGTLIGGAQIGSLAIWYMLDLNINQAINNSDAIQNNPAYTQAEKDAAYSTAVSYSKERRTMQTYCLVGFAGLWAVGAIEAVISGKKTVKNAVTEYRPQDNYFAITPLTTQLGDHLSMVPALALQLKFN